ALGSHDAAALTIVSPSHRRVALTLVTARGPALRPHASLQLLVDGPGGRRRAYRVQGGYLRGPVQLDRGLNRIVLRGRASAAEPTDPRDTTPPSRILIVNPLRLAYNG